MGFNIGNGKDKHKYKNGCETYTWRNKGTGKIAKPAKGNYVDSKKPSNYTKSINDPIYVAYEKVQEESKPLLESSNQEKFDIYNRYGNSEGLQNAVFEHDGKNLYVKTKLDIKDANVPGILSGLSFLMNNNNESSLSLSVNAQNFEESFDLLNAYKGEGSSETISKEEFLLYLQDYSREAVESGDEGNKFRLKEAVRFDKNKEELSKIFDAVAGEDGLVSKKELTDFWKDLFSSGEKYIDGFSGMEMTKVTGDILNKFVNEKLEAQGKLPTFRKTEAEINALEKEKELKDLRVNIDPNLVVEIKHSKDNEIAFLILDDGTEIQFPKWLYNHGSQGCEEGYLNISKDDNGRYVISNKLDERWKHEGTNEHATKIVPNENSKITIKDAEGITYSSPDALNDDVQIEGKVRRIRLIVGEGEDNIVNNQTNDHQDWTVRIAKNYTNTSVELEDEGDIAYTCVKHYDGKDIYYSPNSDEILELQMKSVDNLLKNVTDGELLALANNQELLTAALEGASILEIEGETTSLTDDERENLINEIKKQQKKFFKEINKTAKDIEEDAKNRDKK